MSVCPQLCLLVCRALLKIKGLLKCTLPESRPAEVAMVPRASDLKLKVPPKHRTTKIDKKMAERAKSTNKWAMIIKKLIIMCN